MARRVYSGAYLAQVADSHPAPEGDTRVVNLNPATVAVTDTAVVARVGDVDWVWLLAELEEVVHGGDEPWTILAVPGVADHGVSVSRSDANDFRAALAGLLPVSARVRQLRSAEVVQPLTPPGHSWDAPAPRLPTPLADGPARSPFDSQLGATTAPQPVVGRRGPVPEPAAAPSSRPDTVLSRPPPGLRRHGHVDDPPISVERHRSAPIPGAPNSLAALDARSISAWFGAHQVLDQVSLEMAAGEVTALIGPSGCGKSTFLRILNRMHELIPSASLAGEVLLEGQDIYDPFRKVIDARRQIGMVFQKPNPFPAMSIYDNVVASFKLTGRKATDDEKDDVVESCLRKAGLWNEVRERLRQPGGGLSGGQQQRLCIARALAIRPRVLLMDEPCSALDPTSTRRIEQTISELKSEVTIVIVTHNMQQAARVSDQCAFFLAEQGTPGAIVEHGPTEDMFNAPQDPRTSDYVNGRFG